MPEKLIIASGPVIVENGTVLVNKHGDDEFWKFCGGRRKNTEESLVETAIRRVKEEMGLDVRIINPNPFLMYTTKETSDGTVDVILIHVLAERLSKVAPGPETKEWAWLDIDNLPTDELAPNILPTLKHFGFLS